MLTAAIIFLSTVGPSAAQETGEAAERRGTTFNPSVSAGYGYTDNVVQAGQPEQSASSSTASLALALPLQRSLRSGKLDLAYRGLFRSYEKFGALDHGEHFLDGKLERRFRRRSKLELGVRYGRTQEGGDATRLQDGNIYLSTRVERESYGASATFDKGVGPRWQWSIGVDAGESKIRSIQDFNPEEPPELPAEGARSYAGAAEVRRIVSGRTELGIRYAYRRIEPDVQPTEDDQEFTGRFTRTFRLKSRLGIDVGGYRRSRSNDADFRSSGFSGGVDYSYGPVGRVRFGVGLLVAPSTGGSLQGTSTDTRLAFSVASANTRKWDLGLASYVSRRVASDTTIPDIDVLSATVWVERRFARKLAIRIDGSWVDQSSTLAGFSEGRYSVANAGLVWYPLGGSRLAGGS